MLIKDVTAAAREKFMNTQFIVIMIYTALAYLAEDMKLLTQRKKLIDVARVKYWEYIRERQAQFDIALTQWEGESEFTFIIKRYTAMDVSEIKKVVIKADAMYEAQGRLLSYNHGPGFHILSKSSPDLDRGAWAEITAAKAAFIEAPADVTPLFPAVAPVASNSKGLAKLAEQVAAQINPVSLPGGSELTPDTAQHLQVVSEKQAATVLKDMEKADPEAEPVSLTIIGPIPVKGALAKEVKAATGEVLASVAVPMVEAPALPPPNPPAQSLHETTEPPRVTLPPPRVPSDFDERERAIADPDFPPPGNESPPATRSGGPSLKTILGQPPCLVKPNRRRIKRKARTARARP